MQVTISHAVPTALYARHHPKVLSRPTSRSTFAGKRIQLPNKSGCCQRIIVAPIAAVDPKLDDADTSKEDVPGKQTDKQTANGSRNGHGTESNSMQGEYPSRNALTGGWPGGELGLKKFIEQNCEGVEVKGGVPTNGRPAELTEEQKPGAYPSKDALTGGWSGGEVGLRRDLMKWFPDRFRADDAIPVISWPPPKRPFLLQVLDKSVYTVEDISRHINRALVPLPTRTALDKMVQGRGGRMKLKADKPVVLVLGSGWAAHSLIKVIDTDRFEVVLVSPRNYFFFTPMLPSTAVGSVEFRSLTDPIRMANPFVSYLDAECNSLDVKNKVAVCSSNVGVEEGEGAQFEVDYDYVVVAVGEQPATFGVPGVRENCCFMKEITDAVELRKQIGENFEYAALPSTSEEEKKRALHFVVVGGGPTGVEFSGTLADFVNVDLRRKYPELIPKVQVTLLQSAQSILTMFDQNLQAQALDALATEGVNVRLGVRVVEVTDKQVKLAGGEVLDYGVCVWSAGNSTRDLTQKILDQIPEQSEVNKGLPATARKIGVDPFLRIVGAQDAIALGDCSTLLGNRMPATAQVAAQQGAYVAHIINGGYDLNVGGLEQPPPSKQLPLRGPIQAMQDALGTASLSSVDLEQQPYRTVYFKQPFDFLDLGMMAYVGGDQAATQLQAFDTRTSIFGYLAFVVWKSVYITKQVSFRNRVLILFDWVKAQVFGRDLSLF